MEEGHGKEGALSRFVEIGNAIGNKVTDKNKAYGNSFETVAGALRLLYPNGIKPEQYGDALTLVRVWDKMMRIATDKDAFGESPWEDITGYGILAVEKQWRKLQEDDERRQK